jgi:F-box interacting protein
MAEPGDAAAFIGDAPFEVLKALLGRLSPKWILRMRSVCRAWRGKLCNDALLTRLHRAEPPQPLLCFDRVACPDRYIHLSDYCVESLDLRSGKLRAVFRFTDNEDYFIDEYDLEGRDAPPIIDDLVDYARMKSYGDAILKPHVTVHASLDGYLLVSFSSRRRWYIINPATRHWVSLFDPTTFDLDVIGFYEHGRTGKYHVLCLSRRYTVRAQEAPTCSYHVIEVRPAQRRHIGRPLSPAVRKDHGLRSGVERASISPPIQWKRGNMDLLWPPQQSQGYHMLVFDTWNEKFSWTRPPPVAMADDQDMRLLEFPDGNLGLSVSRENEATLDLWCLQDYRNEVWVLKHRIQLALQQMPALHLHENRPWIPAVVSAEGDVLIESRRGLFHCDRNGNLLHRFWFNQPRSGHRVLPIRHVLRKSLVQHPMFRPRPSNNAAEPPFFRWLCSDPSCSW